MPAALLTFVHRCINPGESGIGEPPHRSTVSRLPFDTTFRHHGSSKAVSTA
jgi:hypothetical protein